MKDIYVKSANYESMLKDMQIAGMSDGVDFFSGDARFCFLFLGKIVDSRAACDESGLEITPATFLPGVFATIRFMDDEAWLAFASTDLQNGTEIVERTQNMPVWA